MLHMSLLLREEGEMDYPFTKCPFQGEMSLKRENNKK